MDTVSILSGKGGTGKSSISVSIAGLLAHCGFRTLIIDLDLFTHGLTFYSLGGSLKKISGSLSDIFMEDKDLSVPPVIVPSSFTSGNLFILPSISDVDQSVEKSVFEEKYTNLNDFRTRVEAIVKRIESSEDFDIVFIDTRGGTDYTSIGAALASDYFIVVTEADRPSWKMGDFLINSIAEAERKEDVYSKRLGFIINKNMLPSKDIEQYLRRKWGMPHVGTIPFDKTAVKYFQENRMTVEEDPGCPFSTEIYEIIKNSFVTNKWTDKNRNRLESAGKSGLFSTILNLFRG